MREILFRGKRIDNGEWTEGYFLQLYRSERAFIVPKLFVQRGTLRMSGETPPKIIPIEVLPETVGQYTGLLDKNGKKIFEGNIIDYTWDTLCGGKEHRTYVISYDDNAATFVGDSVSDTPRHRLPTFIYIGKRGEVIGNIYDNKELLND